MSLSTRFRVQHLHEYTPEFSKTTKFLKFSAFERKDIRRVGDAFRRSPQHPSKSIQRRDTLPVSMNIHALRLEMDQRPIEAWILVLDIELRSTNSELQIADAPCAADGDASEWRWWNEGTLRAALPWSLAESNL